jgi:hypothetical protein
VQIGAISYSFRSMQSEEIIPTMEKIGIGQVELMSNDCEALAGAPLPPRAGRGGGRGQMTPEQREAQRLQQETSKNGGCHLHRPPSRQ